jgi:hypothetical protein
MGTRNPSQDHGPSERLNIGLLSWAELEAQRIELEAEQERLMAEVGPMDPDVGARALRVLADKFELLEQRYRQYNHERERSTP